MCAVKCGQTGRTSIYPVGALADWAPSQRACTQLIGGCGPLALFASRREPECSAPAGFGWRVREAAKVAHLAHCFAGPAEAQRRQTGRPAGRSRGPRARSMIDCAAREQHLIRP